MISIWQRITLANLAMIVINLLWLPTIPVLSRVFSVPVFISIAIGTAIIVWISVFVLTRGWDDR
jgi:hypothetical protein